MLKTVAKVSGITSGLDWALSVFDELLGLSGTDFTTEDIIKPVSAIIPARIKAQRLKNIFQIDALIDGL